MLGKAEYDSGGRCSLLELFDLATKHIHAVNGTAVACLGSRREAVFVFVYTLFSLTLLLSFRFLLLFLSPRRDGGTLGIVCPRPAASLSSDTIASPSRIFVSHGCPCCSAERRRVVL